MQTKLVLKQSSALKLRFQPGATGPGGTVTVGTVTTGAPGSSVIITNTGTPNAAILNFTIPRGDTGLTGDKGWSPILAIVTDGVRRVVQISDWTGGQGTKPATGSYIGATGLVSDIASAIDIRGPQGPSGSVTDGDKVDIVVSSAGTVWTIDANAVTDDKLRDSAGLSVIGRSANSTGDPADIVAATDGHVLRRSGTTVGFGQIATAGISDNAATNAKLADMANSTIKGRATSGTGDPEDLSAAQVRSILGVDRELIVAAALPSAANVDITLPSGYDEICIELFGISASVSGAGIGVQVSTDGTTFATSGYIVSGQYTVIGGSAVGFTSLTSSGSILTGINMPAAGSSNMTIRVRDYLNSSVKKIISVETDQIDTSGNPSYGRFTGAYDAPAALQKVRVVFTTGSSPSFTGGSYRVYGVKKP